MLRDKINTIVRQSITEEVARRLIKEQVKNIVTEEFNALIRQKINEATDSDMKRNAVMDLLKDEKFKNSQLAYTIWPDMDKDTARSLFSKMVSGKPDNDGVVRHFSDEDVNTLYELLRNK